MNARKWAGASLHLIEKSQVLDQFKKWGRNPSHFVWFLAGLQFAEASNGWIFAFTQIKGVTLLALEPLVPAEEFDEASFTQAWTEFLQFVHPQICAFAAIYEPFAKILSKHGFQVLQIGIDP